MIKQYKNILDRKSGSCNSIRHGSSHLQQKIIKIIKATNINQKSNLNIKTYWTVSPVLVIARYNCPCPVQTTLQLFCLPFGFVPFTPRLVIF